MELTSSAANVILNSSHSGIEPPSIGVSNNLLNVTVYWKVSKGYCEHGVTNWSKGEGAGWKLDFRLSTREKLTYECEL